MKVNQPEEKKAYEDYNGNLHKTYLDAYNVNVIEACTRILRDEAGLTDWETTETLQALVKHKEVFRELMGP